MKTPTDNTDPAPTVETVLSREMELAVNTVLSRERDFAKRDFMEQAVVSLGAVIVSQRPLSSYSADDTCKAAELLWDALNRHTPIP